MHYLIAIKQNNWDSVLLPLDDNTLQLTIQVRVFLQKVEPTERKEFVGLSCDGKGNVRDKSKGHMYVIDPWTMTDWQNFENDFKKAILTHWDQQFDLVPNKPWYKSAKGLTAAKVTCGLSLEIVKTSPQNSHASLMIFNTRKIPKPFRSHVNPHVVPKQGFFNRSDVETEWLSWMPHIYRNESAVTKINGVPHAVDYVRNTAAHEFGHILELKHVAGHGNEMKDYGFENVDDADTAMGAGSRQSARFANPWSDRLMKHLIKQTPDDQKVSFVATLSTPQLLGYWDHGELLHVGGNLWMLKSLFGQ